ncbi:MAG: hypothetical protein ACI8P0_005153 [Planctomycetaceae bacterium]|jgi:hypothetical protein
MSVHPVNVITSLSTSLLSGFPWRALLQMVMLTPVVAK